MSDDTTKGRWSHGAPLPAAPRPSDDVERAVWRAYHLGLEAAALRKSAAEQVHAILAALRPTGAENPVPWCQVCGRDVRSVYCAECHEATTLRPSEERQRDKLPSRGISGGAMQAAPYRTEYVTSFHGNPVWEAIWIVIREWDIQREPGAGYAAATGDDATRIYDAVTFSTGAGPRGEDQ